MQEQKTCSQIPVSEGNNVIEKTKYFVKGTQNSIMLTFSQAEEMKKSGLDLTEEKTEQKIKYKRECFLCREMIYIFQKNGKWEKENLDGSFHLDVMKTMQKYPRYQGRNWGTCWECGCQGNLDADGYCGC